MAPPIICGGGSSRQAGCTYGRGSRLSHKQTQNEPPMPPTLFDLIPRDGDLSSDNLLGRFLEYAEGRQLTLYPAQEAAILELFEEKNVILNTPTGSGKSLVAAALHFKSLAQGRRSVYTCPIKALVNEKWLGLCRRIRPGERRPQHRRRLGQPRRADPLLHRRGAGQHRPARRRRHRCPGRGHGRVPLLRRPGARRGLAGAAAHHAQRPLPARCPRPWATPPSSSRN